jgi:protein-L-isoaspartate(D-aspartate) O-methyltransferase
VIDFTFDRNRMVEELASRRGIRDLRVLEALRVVPRHLFVEPEQAARSYKEFALPIGSEQTISQPWVVARMTELLEVTAEHSVLEIGTGSGYQTAILASLSRKVYSIERHATLARTAAQRIRELGFSNVDVQTFDGTIGYSIAAPYDRILVTAGAPEVPKPLLDQLGDGGLMVIPEGDDKRQILVVYARDPSGQLVRREHEAVTFVPLIGKHGWQP